MATLLADFDTAHCGAIHDSQLDPHGRCLATASADGHVRLWDVSEPRTPHFLADLGGHSGAVYQVAWAPPEAGQLLATAGADGFVLIWARRHGEKGFGGETSSLPTDGDLCPTWRVLRRENLAQHGSVNSVVWAPAEHGAALACACADGTVTVLVHHAGVLRTAEADASAEHRWHAQSFLAHAGGAVRGVAWAAACDDAAEASTQGNPLCGARLATAGAGGLRIWRRDEAAAGSWSEEPLDAPGVSADAVALDVAWRPWNGLEEAVAIALGQEVVVWCRDVKRSEESSRACAWKVAHRISLDEDVWRLNFLEVGGVILASCGLDENRRGVLLKQRLSGEWDIMDVVEEEPSEPAVGARSVGAGGA
eukprot:TRINITY_DN37053_c0_g1_i1.p1 TRINITY_DN37053_c0_g1~~TRINITY_DN37053_c0_g1_i1.p1  ORF type:complete len:396 (-),score=75.53 TRINITY_DN37053_c0_g1_i1:133-1227(-)